MRTTINLPEDVYQIAVQFSRAKKLSLGDAVSELIRTGLRQPIRTGKKDGLPVFTLPKEAPTVSTQAVLDALAEEY